MPDPSAQSNHTDFLRLLSQNEAPLRAYVRSMLPSRQETDEVMQEVVVALWQHFETARDFRPWAYAVAKSRVLMYLRRRARDRHIFDEELVTLLGERQSGSTERHASQTEALEECLQKLTAPQREIVLTAYTEQGRIHDLAQTRGETPMALYKKLHRIRQLLLECVRRTLNREEWA